ncbi:hypothetical protein Aperf_G00000005156 [Anoplocephala perfoliata]
MKFLLIFAGLLAVSLSNALTEDERESVLRTHNEKRSQVSPTAANMLQMEYDTDLEDLASKWVQRCVWEHPDRTAYPEYAGVGQNIAYYSLLNLEVMMNGWFNENQDYNYGTNQCSAVCGHYTQMVWANSNRLGCAYTLCDTLTNAPNPGPLYFFACQYKSPGNYVGEKPYESGAPCENCPGGYETCVNNLCTN